MSNPFGCGDRIGRRYRGDYGHLSEVWVTHRGRLTYIRRLPFSEGSSMFFLLFSSPAIYVCKGNSQRAFRFPGRRPLIESDVHGRRLPGQRPAVARLRLFTKWLAGTSFSDLTTLPTLSAIRYEEARPKRMELPGLPSYSGRSPGCRTTQVHGSLSLG